MLVGTILLPWRPATLLRLLVILAGSIFSRMRSSAFFAVITFSQKVITALLFLFSSVIVRMRATGNKSSSMTFFRISLSFSWIGHISTVCCAMSSAVSHLWHMAVSFVLILLVLTEASILGKYLRDSICESPLFVILLPFPRSP